MRHFLISLAETSTRLLNANLAQYLTGLKIRGEQIDKKVLDVHSALAVWSNKNKVGVERQHRRGPITGRIGMRDAPTNRALIAHLNVADALRTRRQQRTDLLQQVRRFQLVVRRRRADQDLVVFFADIRKRLDARDIDQQLRLRETQLHRGNQTMPTREHFRAIEIACEQCDRFIERRRSFVIEWCWNHDLLLMSAL